YDLSKAGGYGQRSHCGPAVEGAAAQEPSLQTGRSDLDDRGARPEGSAGGGARGARGGGDERTQRDRRLDPADKRSGPEGASRREVKRQQCASGVRTTQGIV